MTAIYYTPAAALSHDGCGGFLSTITNRLLMKDVNRYKLEADTKSGKPIVNPDCTLTRPKRLNKFEKVNGMKVVKAGWQEPEKIRKPELLRATTVKGRKKEIRANAAEKAYLAARKAAQND